MICGNFKLPGLRSRTREKQDGGNVEPADSGVAHQQAAVKRHTTEGSGSCYLYQGLICGTTKLCCIARYKTPDKLPNPGSQQKALDITLDVTEQGDRVKSAFSFLHGR